PVAGDPPPVPTLRLAFTGIADILRLVERAHEVAADDVPRSIHQRLADRQRIALQILQELRIVRVDRVVFVRARVVRIVSGPILRPLHIIHLVAGLVQHKYLAHPQRPDADWVARTVLGAEGAYRATVPRAGRVPLVESELAQLVVKKLVPLALPAPRVVL